MRSRVVLIDLPKGGRRVIDYYHLPSEQTAWAAPYRGREGKLCSRKNTNRHNGIFRRSKPDCTRMEVLGSQFLAHLSRTLRNRACGALLLQFPTQPDQPKNCVTRLSVPASSVSVENKWYRLWFRVVRTLRSPGCPFLRKARISASPWPPIGRSLTISPFHNAPRFWIRVAHPPRGTRPASASNFFERQWRVTTDLRIASATVDASCSGGVSEY
jgi:hypothetical protein